MKNVVLKDFAIFTGKLQICNFIKKRLFSSEYCEIFKGNYFEEHLTHMSNRSTICVKLTRVGGWVYLSDLKI